MPQQKGVYRCSDCQETLAAPTLGRRWALVAALLNLVYLVALLVLAITDAAGPEEWGLGSLNLYLPQWLWALPALFLVPATWWLARRWAWAPVIPLLWVLGPGMGLCWHGGWPASPSAPSAGLGRLRVMTYNVKWGGRDGNAIVRDIETFRPDLIQMQDAGGVMDGAIGKELAGWNVRTDGQYLVASRLPLAGLEARDLPFPGSPPYHCVRYLLRVGGADVAVYDVHLLSPRAGLLSVRRQQTEGMEGNAEQRLFEADRLADYVRAEPGPALLTGDLNAPVQSLVCRRLFGAGLRDAFSEAGFGYGYTYGAYTRVGSPFVRIDHVLVSRRWRVRHCWVGSAAGSDHCPVIADLTLTP